MNPIQAGNDLKALRTAVFQQRLAIIGLVLCLMLALTLMYGMVGRERIVVTPPTIHKSFWVESDKVDPSYLEQMGGFMAWLILDVSPQSIDWKKSTLLEYVAPDAYGALQTPQNLEADRLRRLNATTQFSIAQLQPDEQTLSVVVRGRLATFINGTRTSDVERDYLARFDYTGNRIHLKKFEEVTNGQKTVSAAGDAASN